jgi:hypothetical protein
MKGVISAKNVLPNLYEDPDNNHEDVVDDLSYDVYNLASFNYHPVIISADETKKEEALLESTRRATQLLIKKYVEKLSVGR